MNYYKSDHENIGSFKKTSNIYNGIFKFDIVGQKYIFGTGYAPRNYS